MSDQTNGQGETFYLGEEFVRAAIEEGLDAALDRMRARVMAATGEADAATLRVFAVIAEEGIAHYRGELLVEPGAISGGGSPAWRASAASAGHRGLIARPTGAAHLARSLNKHHPLRGNKPGPELRHDHRPLER